MRRWVWYSLLAIVCQGIWSLLSAIASKKLTPYLIQVLSTAGLIPLALAMAFSPNVSQGNRRWRGMGFAAACGLIGGTGNVALYAALNRGGHASLVFPLTGMVTVILARWVLKEKINAMQWAGMALALTAICLFSIVPGDTVSWSWDRLLAPWLALSLLTLVLFGAACIGQKFATMYISDELSIICFTIASVPLALGIAPFVDNWSFSWRDAMLCGFVGFFMGLSTLLLFCAFRWGKASLVTPLAALYPLATVLLAVPILNERLDAPKITAIVLALAAAVALGAESQDTSVPAVPVVSQLKEH
jgi:drug/metabolite transporter (DMT)-like permease